MVSEGRIAGEWGQLSDRGYRSQALWAAVESSDFTQREVGVEPLEGGEQSDLT